MYTMWKWKFSNGIFAFVAFTNELAYQSKGRKWLGTQLLFKKTRECSRQTLSTNLDSIKAFIHALLFTYSSLEIKFPNKIVYVFVWIVHVNECAILNYIFREVEVEVCFIFVVMVLVDITADSNVLSSYIKYSDDKSNNE